MVGRGSFGNPWVFLEIQAAFEGKTFTPLSFEEKIPRLLRHLDVSCEFKGEKWGTLEMRKHFAWYIRGFPRASELRQKFMTVNFRSEAFLLMEEALQYNDKAGAGEPVARLPRTTVGVPVI